MDIVDELRAFVATVQTGPFTAAADQLGVSNRLTSKYVAELETRLGVRLFQRTTRKVGLTPAGEDLLSRAAALLDDLDALLSEVSEGSRGLSGLIRISAPVTFGEVYVGGMLGRFAEQNPGLVFDLRLSDRFVDLATEGIDLAFRLGTSDMLSLKTRKLGMFQTMVVASPDYVARHGAPTTPEELEKHNCIIDSNRRQPRRWTFRRQDEEVSILVQGRFQVNSARAAVDLAVNGHGVANAPRFALYEALESETLIPLLEGVDGDRGLVSAVYLEGRALPRKIRALIDFAVGDFAVEERFHQNLFELR